MLRNALRGARGLSAPLDRPVTLELGVDLEGWDPIELDDGRARELVWALGEALEASGVSGQAPELKLGELWTVATKELRVSPRSIVGGYIQPILRIPVVVPMPDLVVYYLTIDGERDILKREQHSHFGWHYHYLNWKEERSDRILCWDTRAELEHDDDPVGLFHELHAEGGGFKSRPDLWRSRKRESMHNACSPDLSTWPPSAFKQASNGAEPVWPEDRTLSRHPKAKKP